jgi:hypothetical protein
VENSGSGTASGFELVDDYDQAKGSVSGINPTNPGGNAGTDNGDTITWSLPDIPASGSVEVSYTYTLNGGLADGTEIINTACIWSGGANQNVCDDATVTVPTDAPDIRVTKTADPASLVEPGGDVAFTVRVENTGNVSLNLTSLNDDVHGDLNGQGDCSVPRTIPVASAYECSFTVSFTEKNAGFSETDTVTGTASPPTGDPVYYDDNATVTVTNADPAITVTKTASPVTVTEPGGTVTFTVAVANDSESTDPVTIDSLTDDIHGDLDGQGD